MKTRIRGMFAVLAMLPLLALAACGQGAAASNEVSMAEADFSPTTMTIKVGQAVHFTDPAGIGGTHIICLGAEGECDATAQGPQALEGSGFTINSGDSPRDVTFTTPGTYKITCSLHPSMNLTVTVR
ncbi:MAG TPA: plastocyanin/azurin family copper-binding protein [Ktedonobacterales bacterium]|jgi:plastocyanin|nr:plastocyanin/azurin family copper-binding protein [Ktedonobacterales bacterium]